MILFSFINIGQSFLFKQTKHSKQTKTVSRFTKNTPSLYHTNNHLPWIISLDLFRTGIIFLHAHSQESVPRYLFMRSWANEIYGRTERRKRAIPIYPNPPTTTYRDIRRTLSCAECPYLPSLSTATPNPNSDMSDHLCPHTCSIQIQ